MPGLRKPPPRVRPSVVDEKNDKASINNPPEGIPSENHNDIHLAEESAENVKDDQAESEAETDQPLESEAHTKAKAENKRKRSSVKAFGQQCFRCCKAIPSTICPNFPRCCHLPFHTCLQILAVIDLIVSCGNIAVWVYFHQYDPFAVNVLLTDDYNRSTTTTTVKPSHTVTPKFDISDFVESTTSIYGNQMGPKSEGIKTSKIGYRYKQYQQEVENMCGRKYYEEFLAGHGLILTNGVFNDLLTLTYLSEFMYQFVDISILATTCCFFEYTSGRLYLIIIWNMELIPWLAKLYIIVESRSHRLCILQYGLGKTFRGLDALLYMNFVPMIFFRAYIFLVFTYFVASLLELGNLEHQTRIQGVTLHEYVERHEEYLRMDKNRERSSSEDDDVDNL